MGFLAPSILESLSMRRKILHETQDFASLRGGAGGLGCQDLGETGGHVVGALRLGGG